jgi:hypothetical protein
MDRSASASRLGEPDLARLREELEHRLRACRLDPDGDGDDDVLALLEAQPAARLAALARSYPPGELRALLLDALSSRHLFNEALRILDEAEARASGGAGRGPAGLDGAIRAIADAARGNAADLTWPEHGAAPNNRAILLASEAEALDRLQRLSAAAVDFVHLAAAELDPATLELLVAKAEQGASVRALLGTTPDPARRARFAEAGVETAYEPRRPVRRIVFADAASGVVAQLPLFELRGDAVHQLHADWLRAWLEAGGTLEPELPESELRARYFPGLGARKAGSDVVVVRPPELIALLEAATLSVHAELSLSAALLLGPALAAAARRGVAVELIVPEVPTARIPRLASQKLSRDLASSGVRMFLGPARPGLPALCDLVVADRARIVLGGSAVEIYSDKAADQLLSLRAPEGRLELELEDAPLWERIAGFWAAVLAR